MIFYWKCYYSNFPCCHFVPVVKFFIKCFAWEHQLHVGETQLDDEPRVVHCFFLELCHLRNITRNDHLQKTINK